MANMTSFEFTDTDGDPEEIFAFGFRNPFRFTFDFFGLFQGQEIFRFDTFGDEQLWTDVLRMHEVIEQQGRAARRGKKVFHGVANCAKCHIPPLCTDAHLGILHDPEDVGQDRAYALKTTTGKYRTTPLRALWQHAPYFHDGSAKTLDEVVEHYDALFELELSESEQFDLVEFLKSL